MTIVLKFGGTSVSTPQRWKNIRDILENHLKQDPTRQIVVVVSALSGVTNSLIKLTEIENIEDRLELLVEIFNKHTELIRDLKIVFPPLIQKYFIEIESIVRTQFIHFPEIKAKLVSYGELMSSAIGCKYLTHFLIPTKYLDSRDIILNEFNEKCSYENNFLENIVDWNKILVPELDDEYDIFITQGFIGSVRVKGEYRTCLLGRGGSDTTGSIYANILDASFYEIWTDVDGIYNIDPRITKDAVLIENIDYSTAIDIAKLGGKVIHSRCIQPLIDKNIPCIIKNTNNIKATKNTTIHTGSCEYRFLTGKKDVLLIQFENNNDYYKTIFNHLHRYKVDILGMKLIMNNIWIIIDLETTNNKETFLKNMPTEVFSEKSSLIGFINHYPPINNPIVFNFSYDSYFILITANFNLEEKMLNYLI